MPGWTLFRGEARRIFFEECGLDDATIARARGWAIAPSLIGLSYYRDVPHLQQNARGAIEGALADCRARALDFSGHTDTYKVLQCTENLQLTSTRRRCSSS
jgi:hypothetical protein